MGEVVATMAATRRSASDPISVPTLISSMALSHAFRNAIEEPWRLRLMPPGPISGVSFASEREPLA